MDKSAALKAAAVTAALLIISFLVGFALAGLALSGRLWVFVVLAVISVGVFGYFCYNRFKD